MPTYQYQCTECGEGLEAVQKFTDDALTVCPSCDGRLKKVFSAVGIVFKGSGFYRNDSRGSSSSSTPASTASKSSDSASSSSSGSDTKASASSSSSSGSSSSSASAPASSSGTSAA
ncbi:FmdB family zinc ribbon protein [Streptomyces griseus]|uniref:Putative regulatory protein FmdB zinc ribbon domain-containing protein n=1 Tax=Streptomyces griseus subsp. griseus (strain JCM 4626 / CBS 651.72 / NBRC 13350 / KCC S-0626 / ISP 5235) TaxID=455632 RepID=B1VTN0_STRGG|nr:MULTISPECIES: FmdB family zinc ribbon protein [Streptomyces]MYR09625.1 FmdB family transcriptional regulator [Streptomyces sp. SID724]MYR51942.1 FmdB family transcriptional regulator [Streptomyces sp. SID4928]MYT81038.1 FmdB family transcriptional regulator [Streptomyces sp. SID8364]MBW3706770.1 FmdB family transcriptional regulator [Streptomyces griseus]NEB52543.1 FmdB family transcriptional regulator [Streptomyces griseus]